MGNTTLSYGDNTMHHRGYPNAMSHSNTSFPVIQTPVLTMFWDPVGVP